MSPQDTCLDTTVRYRKGKGGLVFVAGMAAVMMAFGSWWDSFADDPNVAGPAPGIRVVVGMLLILAGLGLLLTGVLLRVRRPTLTLAPDLLRIVYGFRTIRIPVSEISGVGLVFTQQWAQRQVSSSWQLMIWRSGVVRGEWVPYFGARQPLMRRSDIEKFDPATETDPAKLEATYVARVARDIYQRVLARQGPAGPLAVTEQQKHVPGGSPIADIRIRAFWSPDGVLGHAEPGSPAWDGWRPGGAVPGLR
jgi:hypothetical protein